MRTCGKAWHQLQAPQLMLTCAAHDREGAIV